MTGYERTWVEVNLDDLAHNMNEIRAHVDKNAKVMAVVKADGYGHGAAEISGILLQNGADCLGVAICDEAISLRNQGISAPVLLLGFTPPERLQDVVRHGFTQTVFSAAFAENVSKAAVALNRQADIHIKVDTGMSRLGFMPNGVSVEEVKAISQLPNVTISGIFTHLAQSDGAVQDFTYEQSAVFHHFINALEAAGVHIPLKHVSNSGAIIGCRPLSMGMVRAGIMLYGLPPSDLADLTEWTLKRALSWKTQVSFVKKLAQDLSIGYGRTFYTKSESVIATIPVGYADGYSRTLSNKGRVLVGGQYAPIVGNVCMDQFMVDVTHIPGVKAGDEVTLIGRQGDNEVTADELAALQGTINYEIVCDISKRVPRIYMQNGTVVKRVNYIV